MRRSPPPPLRPPSRRASWSTLLLLALTVPSPPAVAQSGFVAGGAGVGVGWMTVGERGEGVVGPVVALQAGTDRDGSRRWFVEWAATPFRIESPVLDEGYRAATVLAGRAFGNRLAVSPSVGVQLRSWSGAERVEEADLGLAWGVAVGTRVRLGGGLVLLPELTWRGSSIELEGGVGGQVAALRVLLAGGLR